MDFRILGILEVRQQGQLVPLGTPRNRTVLGVLLNHPNEIVSVDRLVDELWPEHPPRAARTQVHDYLSRLRRALRRGPAGPAAADRLVTRKPGYLLEVRDEELDRYRFERTIQAARGAARESEFDRGLQLYREAHRLWRGTPFADVPTTPTITAAITALTELHLTSLEERFEIALRHDTRTDEDLVGKLTALVAAHPLRENLIAQLMRALHHAGRTADALETGRRAKQRLADELGLDPGPQLQRVERAILRGEPDPVAPMPHGPVTVSSRPAQLPPDVAGFTGRIDQLAWLNMPLDDAAAAVVVSAISGTAGVGKTALAVRWAHQVSDRFPDGQLYVNLRGYHPEQPTDPGDALTGFLSALGVTGRAIPQDLDERAARYRSELADRRMLILLDNAGSVEQVRPLLPGSGSSTVVVTSRNSLAGLVAVTGARRLDLDLLPPADAVTLLGRLIGPRCENDPDSAAILAKQCVRLPLALRVAAELAASRPTSPLADLVAELGHRQRRLDLLDSGEDQYAAVRTVFSWSMQHLPASAATTFRLLGLHPGPEFGPYAVAALSGVSLDDSHRSLETLSRAHLVQRTGQGRYGMHDLLHAYAAELAATQETERERAGAVNRVLDHYHHTASVAMAAAYPYEPEARPRVRPARTPSPDLPTPKLATGWLDLERPNLLAAARVAADHGWPKHTLDLSAILHRHLRTRGRYHEAEALHRLALITARTIGDRTGELTALADLGWVHLLRGRYPQATDSFGQALEIARGIGDRSGELSAIRGLGHLHQRRGAPEQALDHLEEGLRIAQSLDNRVGELNTRNGLAHIHLMQGRLGPALDQYQRALDLARTVGDRAGELNALFGVGYIHLLRRHDEPAREQFGQVLDIARATGNRIGELNALVGLGHLHRLQGRCDRAAECYQQVLNLARAAGHRNGELEALQGLGRLHHTTGSPDLAVSHHRRALELATDLGQPHDQARAHDGLAHAHAALNRPEQARRHWQDALEILTRLGTDQTEDQEANTTTIRTHLAALAAGGRESTPRRPATVQRR